MKRYIEKIKRKFQHTDWKQKYEIEKARADSWEFKYNTLARKVRQLGDEIYNNN